MDCDLIVREVFRRMWESSQKSRALEIRGSGGGSMDECDLKGTLMDEMLDIFHPCKRLAHRQVMYIPMFLKRQI